MGHFHRVVQDNESLPEYKRVPEPYFARAEIWNRSGNYPAAMRDYLRALRYASSSMRESRAYEQYHTKILETIDRFALVPAPLNGAASNARANASVHYGLGVTAFRNGQSDTAHRHFENAASIQPDNPTYWYYAAVAARRAGNDNDAVFNVAYGAYVEHKGYAPSKSRRITGALQHVQGTDRMWLESFRAGDPSGRIVAHVINAGRSGPG